MHSYVAVWQQPGEAREQRLRGTDVQRQFYFLGALGRRRCRKRTPGPPAFSSRNSTPAASKVRRTAKSLATVSEVLSSASSARLIVLRPSAHCLYSMVLAEPCSPKHQRVAPTWPPARLRQLV